MCFHVSITKPIEQIEDRFEANFEWEELYEPYYHFNGFERKYLYIITQENRNLIQPSYWGILPNNIDLNYREKYLSGRKYLNEETNYYVNGKNTLNAQSKNLYTSRLWSQSIYKNRCLIIADGHFEPHTSPDYKYKIPHYFKYKNHGLFAFAGIYNKLDEDLYTASLITREANGFYKKIHNKTNKEGSYRMPLILDKSDEIDWLYPETSIDDVKTLLHTHTKEKIIAHPVSKDLFSRNIDSNKPYIIDPYTYEGFNKKE